MIINFDIETTIQDSIRLKKALQMSKFQCDKLEKEAQEIRLLYQEQIEKNKSLKNDYCKLQQKYQQSFTQSIKDNNCLISQIQQLKKIIDEKQREMELIQIKLIPSLDQDMLRVKLITEMQGPYQQTLQVRDKQIEKLKNKVLQLQRNLEITSLGFKSKIQNLKKQNQDLKTRSEQENNRLMQELNHSLGRYEVQSIQASIMKNQKKQIQQLKSTIEFVNANEQKHVQEIKNLKEERKNLMEKLMMFNSKEALLLEGKNNSISIQKLQQQNIKYIRQLQSIKTQKQKMNRQISKLQQDKTKMLNQHERQITSERSKFINEKNEINSEILTLRQQVRILKNYKIEGESNRDASYEKIKALQKQVHLKTRQIETLKLQSSELAQKEQSKHNFWQISREQKRQNEKKYDQKQNDNTIINKKKKDSKDESQLDNLKRQNQNLKQKLRQANAKILELIRAKMKHGQKKLIQKEAQKDPHQSNVENPIGVFLQYEDSGFTQLIQPTLYAYHHWNK